MLRTLIALSFAVLAGCVAKPPDASAVQQSLAERSNLRVQWNTSSDADAAARKAVDELLAEPLTVDSATQIALLNNPQLQATFEDIGVAQAQLVQAGLLRNPVFSAEVKLPEGGGRANLELSVVQDFLSIVNIPLRKRLAREALTAAQLDVADAVLDLAARTQAAVVRYQAGEQMLAMHRRALPAADAGYEAAKRLNDAGNLPAITLARHQAEAEQARIELANAEVELLEDREAVQVLLGQATPPTWTIAPALPQPPTDPLVGDLESLGLKQRLDVSAARHAVTRAAYTARTAGRLAVFDEGGAGVAAERETEGDWSVGPAVDVPIPLFDVGQGASAEARAEFRRARRTYDAKLVEARSEIRTAAARVGAARRRFELMRDSLLPLRQRIVAETQLLYNGMFVGVFELLEAKRDEVDASRQTIEALRDYWLARVELERAVGGSLKLPTTSAATQPTENQPPTESDHDHAHHH